MRCKGTNRFGEKCKKVTTHPSGYCNAHRPKEVMKIDKKKLDEAKEKLKVAVVQTADSVEKFIKKEPVKATLVAGVLGFVVGVGIGHILGGSRK